ncbi:MAG: hypothetical protein AB7N76_20785 [Planctomycetota bacterium]
MSELWLLAALPGEVARVPRRGSTPLSVPAPGSAFRLGGGGIAWSGMGRRNTVQLLEALAAAGARHVLHLGCAGGLQPGLGAGDARRLVAAWHEGERLECPGDAALWARLAAAGHELPASETVTVREIVDSAQKRALAARYEQAAVVEMETYWAIEAAARLGLSLSCLRVVIDGRDDDLPDLSSALDELGRPRVLSFAKLVLTRPSVLSGLGRSGAAFGRVQQVLGALGAAALR